MTSSPPSSSGAGAGSKPPAKSATLSPAEHGALLERIVDVVPVGIAVVDGDLQVYVWNRWLEANSGLEREKVIGRNLADLYPEMDLAGLRRRAQQVLTLGNLAFFDARIHGHVFPFPNDDRPLGAKLRMMPQSCVVAPLKGLAGESRDFVCLTIVDETAAITAEQRLSTLTEDLIDRSRRDELTRAFNRAHFYEKLIEECRRTQRTGTPLSLVLVDVDKLKQLNDIHGQPAGNLALEAVARTLQSTVRATDCVARWGGDELVMLLPDTDGRGAAELAERVRAGVEALRVPWGPTDELQVTASFGVAESRDPHAPDPLLARADLALHEAKGRGRNRCVVAG